MGTGICLEALPDATHIYVGVRGGKNLNLR